MAIGMTKVLHVKIPVTDLQRSVIWYASLMDLELSNEFIEQGELCGAALRSPEGDLRLRSGSESTVLVPGAGRFRHRCIAYGLPRGSGATLPPLHRAGGACSEVQDRGPNQAIVDVPDPDGTVLRFYWVGETGEPDSFVRLVFGDDGPPTLTTEPRLNAPRIAGR